MASKAGLLRLPVFLRTVLHTAKEQSRHRSSPYPSQFNQEADVNDLLALFAFATFVFLLRVILHRKVFTRLFARRPKQLHPKLSENLFYTIWHTSAFAYYLLGVRPHAHWAISLFTNGPEIIHKLVHPVPPPMNMREHVYYIISGGFYTSSLAFLMVFDGRRSDFHELFIHHLVTVGLIGVSYVYGYVRVGILVVAMHDVGDIFLYCAKFVHYLGCAGWDTALFCVFTVAFYVPRLLMLPRILYAVGVETLQTLVLQPRFNEWAMFFDTYLWHYLFFVLFLGALLVLHCFWFALILKMVHRELFLGVKISESGDIRSDDEGEEKIRAFEQDEEQHENVTSSDAKKEQ